MAQLVDREGADAIGFDLSYGDKKGNERLVKALETYLENEPDGEYSEQVRYVLPVQAKERGKWDDIMGQAEKHLGIPVDEEVVEVPAGLRGEDPENLEQGGATSRDAERFLADLGPEDSVDTNVVDPETGELLDWPTKDTRRAQDDEEAIQKDMEREKEEDEGYFRVPYIPGGYSKTDAGGVQSFDGMDRAQEALGRLRWDNEINAFYDFTWKNIEDLVDDPQQYYDGDYDIGWDMPVAIKRVDGQRFTDEDHNNFRRLTTLFKAATYNISASYVGSTENGTVARFVPSFH